MINKNLVCEIRYFPKHTCVFDSDRDLHPQLACFKEKIALIIFGDLGKKCQSLTCSGGKNLLVISATNCGIVYQAKCSASMVLIVLNVFKDIYF